eukprot:CAMPEP_0197022904 /NCGR_PEP_ID=MMETSP1384-20130603/3705_1 /TAXON_ID=29189 /ORGANISM="Ammonia sp." /LENGTH=234 /DNA_ID=CAMNT_0042451025 /DNA_START=65 /DNA_END=769 /DNA_ORIENTATION=+
MLAILSLLLCSFKFHTALSASLDSQELGVYYDGNVTTPFEYLRGTIIIPGSPMPSLREQFVYYYFGLAKQQLQAGVIVVFCGNKDGCWDNTIGAGYSFYAELSSQGRVAGGEKVAILPGEAAEVTVIQSGTFLSVNITKLSDGKDSYFDIYGANDGGLTDVISGVVMQYPSLQLNVCEDYPTEAFVVSNIIAAETGGSVVNDVAFTLDGKANNTCGGNIAIGTNGKNLQIFGKK